MIIDSDLKMILNKVYGLPASVSVITQIHGWKYGKTDFAFFLTELTKELDLIDEFASNTETTGENKIPFINDFIGYDRWLIHNKRRKMFIYDEVIESSQKRRAMSSTNIQWVKRIPQLSKGRCHIVAVTQSLRLTESTFFNWTFLRGIWTKINKTTVKFHNPQWFNQDYIFNDIIKTNVEFDQYQIATFLNRSGEIEVYNSPEEQIVREWCEGSTDKIVSAHKGERIGNRTINVRKDVIDIVKEYYRNQLSVKWNTTPLEDKGSLTSTINA
jgi:hypothetical protein